VGKAVTATREPFLVLGWNQGAEPVPSSLLGQAARKSSQIGSGCLSGSRFRNAMPPGTTRLRMEEDKVHVPATSAAFVIVQVEREIKEAQLAGVG
jgi:hypothetical protein